MPRNKRSTGSSTIESGQLYENARRRLERDDEKEDEELELEAALFGRKRKRPIASGSTPRASKNTARARSLGEVTADEEDVSDEELYGRDGKEGLGGFFTDVGGMPGVTIGSDAGDASGGGFYTDVGPSRISGGSEDEDKDGDEHQDERSGSDDASGTDSDSEEGSDSDTETASTASSASNPHANSTFTSLTSSIHRCSNPLTTFASSHRARPSSKPLWVDPSDALLSVSTTADHRMRRLVRGTKDAIKDVRMDEDGNEVEVGKVLGGKKVEDRLREKFREMHPVPGWVQKAKEEKVKSDSRSGTDSTKSTAQTLLSDLLSSTTPLTTIPTRSNPSTSASAGPLPRTHLHIKRLPDANIASRTGSATAGRGGGGIVDVVFHPSGAMGGSGSVALAVVGGDKRLRMFSIDGNTNPSLLTLHIPSLPLTTGKFHPSGASLYLAGPRPFFYTYDLRTQRCLRSPKNLFGTASTLTDKNLEKSSFSPDGSMLAIAGRKGAVHILSWGVGGSAGAGQLIMTLNTGRSGGIKDIMWMDGGRELWVLGDGSKVDVWDVGERRCKWRWTDDGGFGGTMLRKSQDSAYCAVGSSTGIVNVYNTSNIAPDAESDFGDLPDASPTPIRSLMNLTTAVSTVNFNHDGQMLAIGSDKKKESFKVFHMPSATAFTNWPTSATPLGTVTASDFSAGSEYIAIGNMQGKVLLYSPSHYHDRHY